MMKLFFTNCVSILSYRLKVKELLARDMRSLHVAMNDGLRKIFGWNRWESVRELRSSFGYSDIFTMAEKRKRKFFSTIKELKTLFLFFSSATVITINSYVVQFLFLVLFPLYSVLDCI